MKTADAGVLAVSYPQDGAPGGWPVVLSHGFPFDVHAYDEVVPRLTAQGANAAANASPTSAGNYAACSGASGHPTGTSIVIHACRHGFGLAAGDPAYEELEERLAAGPRLSCRR